MDASGTIGVHGLRLKNLVEFRTDIVTESVNALERRAQPKNVELAMKKIGKRSNTQAVIERHVKNATCLSGRFGRKVKSSVEL